VYTEKGEEYEKNMRRLERKWTTIPQYLPQPVITTRDKSATIGIIHFGTSKDSTHEAIDRLAAQGYTANDLRIVAFPFHESVATFIAEHETIFVVEQNRDAQLRSLLITELEINPVKLTRILHFNGDPISARVIHEAIDAELATADHGQQAANDNASNQ
jgi:2-oxoglutarate ferredoxin oxidoreductase subunit alpha